MVTDLRRLIDKLFYIVPVKYWNGAAVAVIGALLLGIGNTLLNPSLPEGLLVVTAQKETAAPPVAEKKKVTIPDTINKGNIFRNQRQSFVPPPPTPPKPKPVAKIEKAVVEFKLLGTIITEPSRIAIMNATRTTPSKPAPVVHVSGAQAKPAKEKKPAKPIQAEPQSFHEGDNIFDFVLERVYEDRIELVSLENGQSSVIYLEIEGDKQPAPTAVKEKAKLKKEASRLGVVNVSGAKTKTADTK